MIAARTHAGMWCFQVVSRAASQGFCVVSGFGFMLFDGCARCAAPCWVLVRSNVGAVGLRVGRAAPVGRDGHSLPPGARGRSQATQGQDV